jgi:hypothetical protein
MSQAIHHVCITCASIMCASHVHPLTCLRTPFWSGSLLLSAGLSMLQLQPHHKQLHSLICAMHTSMLLLCLLPQLHAPLHDMMVH